MKLKTLILVPVIGAALANGGLKAYIHYKVTSELDNAITMAAPFAHISYGGLSTDLGGKLTIKQIAITPLATGLEVRVEAVEVQGDGIGFLLDLSQGLGKGEPPEKLSANIWGAEIPVTGDLMDIGPTFNFGPGTQDKAAPEPCSLGGVLQHAGLFDIGYSTLVADSGIGFEYDKDAGDVALMFDYQIEGIESLAMDVSMSGVSSPGMVVMGAMPTFQNFEIAYRIEPDYMKKMVSHCAQKAGQSSQEFINTLFSQSDSYYAQTLGIIPGQGLRTLFKELVTKAGDVHIRAKPSSNFNPSMMPAFRPQDMIAMLGIELSVNNRLITDLSFTMPTSADLMASLQEDSADAGGAEEPPKPVLRWRYVEVKRSELGSYLGRKARIYTSSGQEARPKEGVIDSLRKNKLSIQQRLHGGEFMVHIPLGTVVKAEVMIPQ
ncbi:hypothetical protein [Solemya velesiana gill symbiont]|uniref:Uncharacterized protein n=1 Tax=Solemya velesiana gill symbiont TaxID=1918948 RepID=A0A1T2KYG8_9GAMM|nr:hypothetical protein [Solemya velesiana gill symbiont]OOZ37873.1 hypothetical protein BOW51_00235 [Solemya velesiana gill symbiont]